MGKVVTFDPLLLLTLKHAFEAGYEAGFVARPTRELHVLRIRGLIERNPTCSTHWRITSEGETTWKNHRDRT